MNLAYRTLLLMLMLTLMAGAAGCSSGSAAPTGEGAGKTAKSAPAATATRVEAAVVKSSTAVMTLVRPGEVEPFRESRVAAPNGGAVESVPVEVGDVVTKGAVLARVDTRIQAANTRVLKVEVAEARRELARLEFMGKAIAPSRVDAAQTRVDRADAQLAVARIQTERSVVRAPFGGTIAAVGTEVGEVLMPGMFVARLIQMDPAVISVSVADRDVGGLLVGGTALVNAAGLAAGVEGTIARIDPAADEKTRTFRVEIDVPNSANTLRTGMIATVDFRGVVATEAILLPQEVLVTQLDQNGVYVVDGDNVARWRPLELGSIIRDQVVVDKGLKAGERIVVLGHRGLADGDALIIARQGVCCTDGRVTHQPSADQEAGK